MKYQNSNCSNTSRYILSDWVTITYNGLIWPKLAIVAAFTLDLSTVKNYVSLMYKMVLMMNSSIVYSSGHFNEEIW